MFNKYREEVFSSCMRSMHSLDGGSYKRMHNTPVSSRRPMRLQKEYYQLSP